MEIPAVPRPRVLFLASLALALVLVLFTAAAMLMPSAHAAKAAPDPSGKATRAYWVFFRDRGGMNAGSLDLVKMADALPMEAWARRSRTADLLPDLDDVGPWEPYVRRVAREGVLRHRTRWLNGVSCMLSPEAVRRVSAFRFVDHVQPVAVGHIQGLGPAQSRDGMPLERTIGPPTARTAQVGPYGPSLGQLQEIGVPALHALGYSGNRVRMMMLDTGFRKDHHAFGHAHILSEWDFVFHDGNTQDQPGDDPYQHFHGTGTWAVAGGYDPGHLIGPAYGATFVLAKTEDVRSETRVEEDNYVAALEWADSLGVEVTSASLCYTCFDDGFCYVYPMRDGHTAVISRAIDVAARRGILCVNAAGNYGDQPMSLGTPADADSMIAVGAVDSLNVIAGFSSRGPTDDGRIKPEVVARGVFTWWADATATDTYGYASGTSLSTPLTGGACALLREAHPEWSNLDVRAALTSTADRHGSPDNVYGWGRVNLPAALNFSPVVFPLPFSLLVPADSATVSTFAPKFVWRASHIPDSVGSLSYTLRLWELSPSGPQWGLAAGPDTSYTLPFALNPSALYGWHIEAEDSRGHRRISREDFVLATPGAASVPSIPGAPGGRLTVRLGPNPFATSCAFQVRAPESGKTDEPLLWAVYDPLGRRVAASEAQVRGGAFSGQWDGRDLHGNAVPAGIYYLELRLDGAFARRTLVRLRGPQVPSGEGR